MFYLFSGSCYCGEDKYCMCTPSLAIDAIIEIHHNNDNTQKESLSSNLENVPDKKNRFLVQNIGTSATDILPVSTASANLVRSKDNESIIKRHLLNDNMVDIHPRNIVRNELLSNRYSFTNIHGIENKNVKMKIQDAVDVNSNVNLIKNIKTEKKGPSQNLRNEKRDHTITRNQDPGSPNRILKSDTMYINNSEYQSKNTKTKIKASTKTEMEIGTRIKTEITKGVNFEIAFNISLVLVFRGALPSGYAIPGGKK